MLASSMTVGKSEPYFYCVSSRDHSVASCHKVLVIIALGDEGEKDLVQGWGDRLVSEEVSS